MTHSNPPISTLAEKKLFAFDLDGTIYLGDSVFPFALRFLRHLREAGKQIAFLTNNASRSSDEYWERLNALGIKADPKEILTAGDVTIDYLLSYHKDDRIYPIVSPGLAENLKKRGLLLVDESAEQADLVLLSLDPTMTYRKLNAACNYIWKGAAFLCTHVDRNYPVGDGIVTDCGALAATVTTATGKKPIFLGKPSALTADLLCRRFDVAPEEVCMFGDRLYTDIALGKRNGLLSVLVLTGEAQEQDLKGLPEEERPDFVFPSLSETDLALFGEHE